MQIMLYDAAQKQMRPLEDGPPPGNQWLPRIQGNKVVWVDHRTTPGDPWKPTNADIYLYDLSTGKEVPVTTNPARQDHPDVWGEWVVWEDLRNNPNPLESSNNKIQNMDIYARNMKTGQELQVTNLPGIEQRPRVDGGRVVFSMWAPDGQLALYMIKLPDT